jgi:hypothetical protein
MYTVIQILTYLACYNEYYPGSFAGGAIGTTVSCPVYGHAPLTLLGVVGMDIPLSLLERKLGNTEALWGLVNQATADSCPRVELHQCQGTSGDDAMCNRTCLHDKDYVQVEVQVCPGINDHPSNLWANTDRKGTTYAEIACCVVGEDWPSMRCIRLPDFPIRAIVGGTLGGLIMACTISALLGATLAAALILLSRQSYLESTKRSWTDDTPELIYTKRLCDDGSEESVSKLPRPSTYAIQSNSREEPSIFISHAGIDSRECIARPTHWFLVNCLEIETFFDEHDMIWGDKIDQSLGELAYGCTDALVILSPNFRRKKYCVSELNTFVFRRDINEDGIVVLPVLWKLEELSGYSVAISKSVWVKGGSDDPALFLTQTLWPHLTKRFKKFHAGGWLKKLFAGRKQINFDKCLAQYVESNREALARKGTKIPSCLYNHAFRTKGW